MSSSLSHRRLRKHPLGRYRYVRLRWRVLFTLVDLAGGLVFGVARRVRAMAWAGRGPRRNGGQARPLNEAPGEGAGDPRVVLLVQLDQMGDAVITGAMLPLLRQRYPRASIEVLSGAWNRELFEAMPEVDRVHVSRASWFSGGGRFGSIVGALWWGLALRRRRVDLAIDVRGEFPVALLLWLSGARRRVGWGSGGGGFLLTDSPRYVHGRPEVESRLALLAELGIRPAAGAEPVRPVFRPTEQARRLVAYRLGRLVAEGALEGPPIVLHVGAGTEAKRWPAEHWRQLAGRLVVELGRQVVLVGGPGDRIIARRVGGPKPWPGVADWTGQLGVVELAALLERAELAVGADSGPAHLAAAVGTSVVVLFSGTNGRRQWQPRGDRVTVLRRPVACSPCHRGRCARAGHPCMRGLSPERVLAAVQRELSLKEDVRRVGRAKRVPRD